MFASNKYFNLAVKLTHFTRRMKTIFFSPGPTHKCRTHFLKICSLFCQIFETRDPKNTDLPFFVNKIFAKFIRLSLDSIFMVLFRCIYILELCQRKKNVAKYLLCDAQNPSFKPKSEISYFWSVKIHNVLKRSINLALTR